MILRKINETSGHSNMQFRQKALGKILTSLDEILCHLLFSVADIKPKTHNREKDQYD